MLRLSAGRLLGGYDTQIRMGGCRRVHLVGLLVRVIRASATWNEQARAMHYVHPRVMFPSIY